MKSKIHEHPKKSIMRVSKQFILSIATMLMMGVSISAFAAKNEDGTVNQLIVKSFKKDFNGASNIIWEQRDTYTKATFSLHGQVLFAYYNNNGDLQAVVRNITSDQLPISLLSSLRKEYGNCWISDLFEIVSDDQTSYYVTLEDSDKKVVLKSQGTEFWSEFKKEKKGAGL
ncbi:MAG TPA: hypothetical protein VHE34_26405 [Puia sp.]|uniref:hypothetical protein n=1 Tax=Puia sp. TaxID=2045100 RepID=UPI002BD9CA2D|nr:hypothetical protein [Puia sp.]HVU98793.1 hypothetical protein [Puia sp.]